MYNQNWLVECYNKGIAKSDKIICVYSFVIENCSELQALREAESDPWG